MMLFNMLCNPILSPLVWFSVRAQAPVIGWDLLILFAAAKFLLFRGRCSARSASRKSLLEPLPQCRCSHLRRSFQDDETSALQVLDQAASPRSRT